MGFVSLRTKTTFWVVVLSMLTNGFSGSYLVWKSYQSLRQQAQQTQLALAKTIAGEMDRGFSDAFKTIGFLAEDPRTFKAKTTDLNHEMTLATTAAEFIDALFYFKPDVKLYAQSLTTIPPKDFPPREIIRETLDQAGQTNPRVLVDFYASVSGDTEITVSTPVLRRGKTMGALVGVMQMSKHAIGNLDLSRIGKSGFAYLVNRDGIAIIHPNRSKWLRDMSENPAVSAFKKQKEGVLHFKNPDGNEILAAFATINTSGWGVVVRQPASECFGPAKHMLRVMTFFMFLILLLSLFLSMFLSDHVVRPLLSLALQVRQYESGILDPKAFEVVKPVDEVGILKHSIGRMARIIQIQGHEREKSYQRTLRAERKAAESARLAEIGHLSAGLAHELNNPLAVILGAARMVDEDHKKGKNKWLGEIQREAERCQRLVSDLLDFARPLRLRLHRTDLGRLAEETWNSVPLGKEIYRLEKNPVSFEALVDTDRFRQVFFNLFRNAVEAMPAGGKVRVSFRKYGQQVRMLISDQGQGVSLKNQPKLFRAFFTTKPKGTGLGLAIARSILQAHGGKISIKPNRPRGITIILEWPQNGLPKRSG